MRHDLSLAFRENHEPGTLRLLRPLITLGQQRLILGLLDHVKRQSPRLEDLAILGWLPDSGAVEGRVDAHLAM